MKYFYLLFLILSLFSFTLEQTRSELKLKKCLSQCKIIRNLHNRSEIEEMAKDLIPLTKK